MVVRTDGCVTLTFPMSFLPAENGNGAYSSHDDSQIWKEGAFPSYLQEDITTSEFCDIWEEAKKKAGDTSKKDCLLWRSIRKEAEKDARLEPLLSSFLYASILSHDSFERSLAFVLANRLSDTTLLATELFEVFHQILCSHREVCEAALVDLSAVRERDPACESYSQALLHYKGYHAIQAHRIAHCLWCSGRRIMATALQSRSSEVFAVDIHPAAQLGKGVLLDHGTGLVIGETAVVGNNVSILHNVTLGGTGKEHGDRHPKISDNVLIGASATILGNIRIGKGAQVAAGSLVLKPVPPRTMVAGSPAKEIGTVSGNPAESMQQWRDSEIIDEQKEPCTLEEALSPKPKSKHKKPNDHSISKSSIETHEAPKGSKNRLHLHGKKNRRTVTPSSVAHTSETHDDATKRSSTEVDIEYMI